MKKGPYLFPGTQGIHQRQVYRWWKWDTSPWTARTTSENAHRL